MINLKEIKDSLTSNPSNLILVDGGYLDLDLKVIFEYYRDIEPEVEFFKIYSAHHSEYDFLDFAKCYLENLIGFQLEFSYTEDEWLQIKKL